MATTNLCYSIHLSILILFWSQCTLQTVFALDDNQQEEVESSASNEGVQNMAQTADTTSVHLSILDSIFRVITVILILVVCTLLFVTTYKVIGHCCPVKRKRTMTLNHVSKPSYDSVSNKKENESIAIKVKYDNDYDHEDDVKA